MSSTVNVVQYLDVLEMAYNGRWRLPEFQRDFKWKVKQNISLFDSLRNGFPIGTFLTSKPEVITNIKDMRYSKTTQDAELLVLDGQQRITAGLQLFYADRHSSQKTFYYIDLKNLEKLIEIHEDANKGWDRNNDKDIATFGTDYLEADDGYIVSRQNIKKNPIELFEKKGMIHTNLLLRKNEREYDIGKLAYLAKNPNKKRLIEIFSIIFRENVTFDGPIPNIVIDTKDTKVLTRIFSTLNTSGTSLTPFEITVSEMFGVGINLIDDIQKYLSKSTYLKQVDRDKTLILQACLLLDNGNHKKRGLPKNLNKEIWEKYRDRAFNAIEELGEFLTKEMGMALDNTNKYVPYDTAFLPLIFIFDKYDKTWRSKNPDFAKIIKYYVVASALKTRYTEGSDNKQTVDKNKLVEAIDNSDYKILDSVFENVFSGLSDVTFSGAKGKIILCIQNAQKVNDVLFDTNTNLSEKHEIHHIFPKETLKKLKGKANYSVNHISNLMITLEKTNSAFSNQDPSQQVALCKTQNPTNYQDLFEKHFISSGAIAILEKPLKSAQEYDAFIEKRNITLCDHISKKFNIKVAIESSSSIEDEDIQLDSDEEAV